MCVALILLTNSFYKVYYWLFDLCEHALVSLLLLATVFLFFLPVVANLESDEQRPLFTIAVLVSGVVGGLAVVITVVYLYRFCLKKRPPVTTTGKPEQKREQIRSELTSQCRPLPLLKEDRPSREHTLETNLDRESAFGSPTKIAQVFPLLTKEGSYIQRSIHDHQNSAIHKAFLTVGDPPIRAHSADLLAVNEPPEIRRASCDVPRGTGRQLPSTAGLEKQYAERQRRMSTFARSDAVQGSSYLPRKQNSTPLPDHPRIYDRGHAHSRSWNPECPSPPPQPERTHYQYYQMDEVYPEPMYIPTINEPLVHSLGVRQQFRQAKSFDERPIPSDRRMSSDRRTLSVVERGGANRQGSIQMNLPPETPVAAACQTLWAARGHLEQLHALGISDPSSASTSFDSNTDSQTAGAGPGGEERRREDAERKRSKYKHPMEPMLWESRSERRNHRSHEPSSLEFDLQSARMKRMSFKATKPQRFDQVSPERKSHLRSSSVTRKHGSHVQLIPPHRPTTRRETRKYWRPVEEGPFIVFREAGRLPHQRIKDLRGPPHSTNRRISNSTVDIGYSTERRESNISSDVRSDRLDDFIEKNRWEPSSRRKRESYDPESRDAMVATLPRRMNKGRSPKYSGTRHDSVLPHHFHRTAPRTMYDRRVSRSHESAYPVLYRANEPTMGHHQVYSRRSSRDSDWDDRRHTNLSLLVQRKFLSTAAVSSMDSSTESSAPDGMFASSVDSNRSDLEQRRLSLLTHSPHIPGPSFSVSMDQGRQRRTLHDRDYSVDTTSDNLFREWSRVDPAYEQREVRPRTLQRGVTEDHYGRSRPYSRQMSVAGSGVVVPLICYPDEQNCSR